MANVTINSDVGSIEIHLGDYTNYGSKKLLIDRAELRIVDMISSDSDIIKIEFSDERYISLSHTQQPETYVYVVDSVNGSGAFATIEDLWVAIKGLKTNAVPVDIRGQKAPLQITNIL